MAAEAVNETGTIVRCGPYVQHLWSTVMSALRQTAGRGEIVLVIDPSTPAASQEWIRCAARRESLVMVEAGSPHPGAVFNAGIRAAADSFIACVDAGDLLDRRFQTLAASTLRERDDIAIVASAVQIVSRRGVRVSSVNGAITADHHAHSRTDEAARAITLAEVLGNTHALHGASMFRRDDWAALGGFDESLPSLARYEFWIRLLARGGSCWALEEPLLVRTMRADSFYRGDSDQERYIVSMAAVLRRHAALFREAPATSLCAREQMLEELGARHLHLLNQRGEGVAQLEALQDRIATSARLSRTGEQFDFRQLQRLTPLSANWGFDRGHPIDRYYIERFLAAHAEDITGTVLEVGSADYTQRFGGARVCQSDVLDLQPANPHATIVTDLRCAANVASASYTCVILTQVLHLIDDVEAALRECERILTPGGILLATVPCASRIASEPGADMDWHRFTPAGAVEIFSHVFAREGLEVEAEGNVLANAAFLYGLAVHELRGSALDWNDPAFPLIVTVRAQKPPNHRVWSSRPRESHHRRTGAMPDLASAVLLYHRVAERIPDPHGLCVQPDVFRDNLAHLCSHYHLVPLEALIAGASAGTLGPGNIAITFDDGYSDALSTASSILGEFSVPATFFVPTGGLEQPSPFWWDVLADAFLSDQTAALSPLRLEFPNGAVEFCAATEHDRAASHRTIHRMLTTSSPEVIARNVELIVNWAAVRGSTRNADRMDLAELKELAARDGHSIGAHSVTHAMLPCQPERLQEEEARASRRALERALGREVRLFSYPFGAWSLATVEAARSAGYAAAVTCVNVPIVRGAEALRIPRLVVTPDRAARFADWIDSQLTDRTSARGLGLERRHRRGNREQEKEQTPRRGRADGDRRKRR